ncbi:Hypothetical predicted protein [Cloeon dipterum]|uniref:C-type lectin domain-containing protein n=1 Tax=Cloeon dipterum TaxID=197152 RepID=A0A8S1DSL2_9INSE|nr:Hypothetical predicted protein [Cloeon dipterum]
MQKFCLIFACVLAYGNAESTTNKPNQQPALNGTNCHNHDVLTLTTLANGKKYVFVSWGKANWESAKALCEKSNMTLALPKTQEELTLLHEMAKEKIPYPSSGWWVLASDVGQKAGDFRWGDGQALPRDSALWDKEYDQPDMFGRGEAACVYFYTRVSARLKDNLCSITLNFVCEPRPGCP